MKNEHPRVLPSEQDDIVNSLNYEGIAVIELQFTTFLTVTGYVALSRSSFQMINVMVIDIAGNNPSYYYRACCYLNCSECFQRHLMFCTCDTTSGILRNGAIKHIFYTNQIHGGIISRCSLFILSLHALALHLAVKILLQIFLYEDLTRYCHIHLSVCNFPPECQQDRTLLRNQYY